MHDLGQLVVCVSLMALQAFSGVLCSPGFWIHSQPLTLAFRTGNDPACANAAKLIKAMSL